MAQCVAVALPNQASNSERSFGQHILHAGFPSQLISHISLHYQLMRLVSSVVRLAIFKK
jgi:hypothetical protein